MQDPAVVLGSSSVYQDQFVQTDGIQGFQFGNQKKMADQQWSIACLELEIYLESRWSNAIWLVLW